MSMLTGDGENQEPLTDPGDPRQRWYHPGNPNCRWVMTGLVLLAGALLIILVVSGAVNFGKQGGVFPGLSLLFFGGVQLFFLLRHRCCPATGPTGRRNHYVPNAAAYRPNPNNAPPPLRHGESVAPPVGGYNYGSYAQAYGAPPADAVVAPYVYQPPPPANAYPNAATPGFP
jgi:hypothetical protein